MMSDFWNNPLNNIIGGGPLIKVRLQSKQKIAEGVWVLKHGKGDVGETLEGLRGATIMK